MFHLLPPSSSPHENTPGSVVTSVLIHLLIIGFAAATTRGVLQATKQPAPKEPVLLLLPRPAEPPSLPELPSNPVGPEPERFQTIPIPAEVPLAIPPVDLGRRPFDPRDLVWGEAENPLDKGEISAEDGAPDGIYDPTTGLHGFEPAELLSQPTPRYPRALLSAGVAGAVSLEFVVDTAGRVETSSVRIFESSNTGFEDAARRAVLGATFRPARLRGHPVRQLTRQRVRFVADDR